MQTVTWTETKSKIEEAVSNGAGDEALSLVLPFISYPGASADQTAWPEALMVFRAMCAQRGSPLAQHVENVLTDPTDAHALFDAGYAAYEVGLFGVAAEFLWRANRVLPEQPGIVMELVACFEELMAYGAAAKVLDESPEVLSSSFLARYLRCFVAVMTGDLGAAETLCGSLGEPADEKEVFLAAAVANMLQRGAALSPVVPLDERALQGWHAVINGGLLLHVSPHGLDEPMRGRYAFVHDTYALCREGIDKLRMCLEHAGLAPAQVIVMPDHDSQIIGRATGEILGLPVVEGPSTEPGLVVSYDADRLGTAERMQALEFHQPDQIWFSHASRWIEPFPFCPDVTSFLYQVNVAPWEPGPGQSEQQPLGLEEAAAAIVSATSEDTDMGVLRATLDATKVLAEAAALGIRRSSGQRLRFRNGSPVPSARFI
jgi:hypothetical protein